MLDRFASHLAQTGLLPEGARILVGYSGGADSTCLLHLLVQLRLDVVAAHLHHGMRPEADDEMAKCAEFCEKLEVPFASGRADVPLMASDMGWSLEEAGRNARYEFLGRAMHGTECTCIATAHTLDDHAETVLLNLARGTGLRGLAGIPARRDAIVRPLLPFRRSEIRAYCQDHGLWFHDDPANLDLANARSRIRQNVMPELQIINSAVLSNVARLAAIADREDRFLDGMAAAALEQAEIRLNEPVSFLTEDVEVSFHTAHLQALPEVLALRAVRLALSALGGETNSAQIEAVVSGLKSGRDGSVTAEGGLVVAEWDGERLHCRTLQADGPFRYPLTVPGETIADALGWQFVAHSADPETAQREPRSLDVVVSADAIRGPLYFRSSEPNDVFQPLGMSGRKRVSEAMADAHYTPLARARLPIVFDLVGPVWVPGIAIADRVKIVSTTQTALRLGFGPILDGAEDSRRNTGAR